MDITDIDSLSQLQMPYWYRASEGEIEYDVATRWGFVHQVAMLDQDCIFPDARSAITLDEWRELLGQIPLLEQLNLIWLGRNDVARISSIIQAAREQCPRLRQIVVSTHVAMQNGKFGEPPEATQALINAALSPTSHPSALRELRMGIPSLFHPARLEVMAEFLMGICDVHPDIELLSGYRDLLVVKDKLMCTEQWFITTETWERLCATQTKLRMFDWVVVPFATSFFEIFGRYPKLQLEKLVFSTAMNWNWYDYRAKLHIPRSAMGYGPTARNAHEALKACPNLLDLEIALYLPGDNDGGPVVAGFLWFVGQAQLEQRVPNEFMLDKEMFGDEFCEALADHCKKLQTFSIQRVLPYSIQPRTIETFTDRAMCALATLSSLRSVQLNAVNITGEGLFSLVACFAYDSANAKAQREFVITVGDEMRTATEAAFYGILEGFLEELFARETEELQCARCPVALRLVNGSSTQMDREWSEGYLLRLRRLAFAAKIKLKRASVFVFTRGYYDGKFTTLSSFDEIVEFGFFTDGATPQSAWDGRTKLTTSTLTASCATVALLPRTVATPRQPQPQGRCPASP